MEDMKINIESSTVCNSHCVFCPHGKMTRPRGQMSDQLFHKVIKDGKDMGVTDYSPFFMGEPFVFPKIWEWLDYMEKEGVTAALYTNGEFLDVERVVKYKNIRYLDFSINAASKEVYDKVMRGPDWEKVTANYFKARKLAPFMVRASMVVVEDNAHEVNLFKIKFGRTKVGGFDNWMGDMASPLARKGEKKPCWVLFHQMMILWDGRVVPCCSDYDAKMVLGDVNKQTIKEVWDSYAWMRDKHLKGEWGDIAICSNCNYNVND